MDQYKTVVLAEANIKGVVPPTFEDEPTIPSASDMEVDFSVKPDRFSTCLDHFQYISLFLLLK